MIHPARGWSDQAPSERQVGIRNVVGKLVQEARPPCSAVTHMGLACQIGVSSPSTARARHCETGSCGSIVVRRSSRGSSPRRSAQTGSSQSRDSTPRKIMGHRDVGKQAVVEDHYVECGEPDPLFESAPCAGSACGPLLRRAHLCRLQSPRAWRRSRAGHRRAWRLVATMVTPLCLTAPVGEVRIGARFGRKRPSLLFRSPLGSPPDLKLLCHFWQEGGTGITRGSKCHRETLDGSLRRRAWVRPSPGPARRRER